MIMDWEERLKIDYYRINGHGHVLPEPEEIPRFMQEKELFWISQDRKYMHQKNWRRPIDSEIFFVDKRLPWMDKHSIDHEVILNLSQLYGNQLSGQTLKDVIRFQNDWNAELQNRFPDRFTGGFVVQAADRDFALEELQRCVEELNMSVLCLPTHFLHPLEKGWRSIATEWTIPLFELADHYGLAVEIHPYDGPKMIDLDDKFWRFHLVWMCAQTADAYHMFTMMNFHNRFDKIRTCFAHGNQFGQINIGRRKQGYKGRPDLFVDAQDPEEALSSSSIFFDTLMHDIYALELTIKRQGVDFIVAGLDDPYPLGEVDSVDDSYPGKLIDDAVDAGIISPQNRKDIWNKNVLNWLVGEDQAEIKKRLNIE